MTGTMELTNIMVGGVLILTGLAVSHGKLYFLISGYNTMTKERKKHFDIEGFSKLFRNCFLLMGTVIILGQYLLVFLGWSRAPYWIISISVGSIMPYLLIRGQRYDGFKNQNTKK
jgi:hypothetical protein